LLISLTPGFSRLGKEERAARRFTGFRQNTKPLKRFFAFLGGNT
jgi:hypothetical protein